jgi:Zn/Cd-binding protein ZinT
MTITIANGKFTLGYQLQTQSGTVSVTGNTITFTSGGEKMTATLSDDGKSFTMGGETFRKQ